MCVSIARMFYVLVKNIWYFNYSSLKRLFTCWWPFTKHWLFAYLTECFLHLLDCRVQTGRNDFRVDSEDKQRRSPSVGRIRIGSVHQNRFGENPPELEKLGLEFVHPEERSSDPTDQRPREPRRPRCGLHTSSIVGQQESVEIINIEDWTRPASLANSFSYVANHCKKANPIR